MTFAWAITETDFGIGAVVVVIIAILLYRLFRREPMNRIVRLGIFLERERLVEGEQVTERKEWPKLKDD